MDSTMEENEMLKQFLSEEEGQTTVEYIMIIAVIVLAISLFGKKLGDLLPQTIERVFAGINKKIDQLMGAAVGQ